MSEDTIPFSSDSEFVDETEEDEKPSKPSESIDLSDPEKVTVAEEEIEVIENEETYVSGPIVSNKPDEKLTKEYEKKLIKGLFHRKV